MESSFPLYWPEHRPRTPAHQRQASKFKATFGAAIVEVRRQLNLLGVQHPVISTNVRVRQDGVPMARASKHPTDPAAAVYFLYKSRQLCFACDRWHVVEDNVWAIAKTIDAMRGILRWGTGEMMDAAFSGFVAIAPPAPFDWRSELGPVHTLAEAESAYRAKAKLRHPDSPGGSHESMARLNQAIARARLELPT
jgi:hypothetical protein